MNLRFYEQSDLSFIMRYNSMSCEFCDYFANIEPQRIVYEDEDYMAFIAREPVCNGHCVIIPKEHSESISDVVELKRFFALISYLCQAIKDAVNAADVRIETLYSHDKIKHTHVHLIPSFSNENDANTAESISNADEKILGNLRKSKWYNTLNA